MSADFPLYILRSVLQAQSRTSRKNCSSRDYSSRILSSASTHPARTSRLALLLPPGNAKGQRAAYGVVMLSGLSGMPFLGHILQEIVQKKL
jgi:hypothetical protein